MKIQNNRHIRYSGSMTLDECRAFYAEEIRYAGNVTSERLVDAFARAPREKFLGPGPWRVAALNSFGSAGYFSTADGDPRRLYHNVLVAIDEARSLNNGQPSSLASWINALDLKRGERVFHVGCGVGYYTAIMAEVVGPEGQVVGSEVDADLASRAKENLAGYPNVEVQGIDGAALQPGVCDAILVNAGVTHPHPAWLDSLREGGRMIMPLTASTTSNAGTGVMLKVTRQGDAYPAAIVSYVMIYPCTSVRDVEMDVLLKQALATGALPKIRLVRRDAHEREATCIAHGQGVCLSAG